MSVKRSVKSVKNDEEPSVVLESEKVPRPATEEESVSLNLKNIRENLVKQALVEGDRLTIVETIHHQTRDHGTPTTLENRFSRSLTSHEQVYVRRFKVGERILPLDTGWMTESGMLAISNDEGKVSALQSSPEEKEERKKKVIEVLFQGSQELLPFAVILPGESLRFQPTNLKAIYLRSRSGEPRCTVTIFPV